MEVTMKKRKWNWIEHMLHKPNDDITKQFLWYKITGRRKKGRPKETYSQKPKGQKYEMAGDEEYS